MVTIQLPKEISYEKLGISKELYEKEVVGNHLPIVSADNENIFVLIGQNPVPVKVHISWLLK